MLIEKIMENKARKIRQSPCHTNRASELGHPCLRYLVFRRTRWQDAVLHDVGLQTLFDEGNQQEQTVIRDLMDAGVTILESQRDYEEKKLKITGHIDGKVMVVGPEENVVRAYPFEVKSMSPYVFRAVNTVADMENGKFVHLKKYPAQLQLYMLLANSEKGVFILKDRSSGALKEIWMDLDLEYCEALYKKAEAVNAAVESGTVPEPIEWDEQLCGRCQFGPICLPEAKRNALEFLENPEIETKLKRREELKPAATEYRELDEEIKASLKEIEKAVIGDFLVSGTWVDKKGFEVKPSRYWKMKVSFIGQAKSEELP